MLVKLNSLPPKRRFRLIGDPKIPVADKDGTIIYHSSGRSYVRFDGSDYDTYVAPEMEVEDLGAEGEVKETAKDGHEGKVYQTKGLTDICDGVGCGINVTPSWTVYVTADGGKVFHSLKCARENGFAKGNDAHYAALKRGLITQKEEEQIS